MAKLPFSISHSSDPAVRRGRCKFRAGNHLCGTYSTRLCRRTIRQCLLPASIGLQWPRTHLDVTDGRRPFKVKKSLSIRSERWRSVRGDARSNDVHHERHEEGYQFGVVFWYQCARCSLTWGSCVTSHQCHAHGEDYGNAPFCRTNSQFWIDTLRTSLHEKLRFVDMVNIWFIF